MTEVLKPGCWDKTCQRCHERVSAIYSSMKTLLSFWQFYNLDS